MPSPGGKRIAPTKRLRDCGNEEINLSQDLMNTFLSRGDHALQDSDNEVAKEEEVWSSLQKAL